MIAIPQTKPPVNWVEKDFCPGLSFHFTSKTCERARKTFKQEYA